MRAIKLTMQAFGAYTTKTTLELGKLHGLYLICGDTGSGKTMIFDAITFALYGGASGELRDPVTLRSKFAQPDDMTYVELTFESGGKEYTIYRELGKEKLKRNSEKTFVKSTEAHLCMPDGSMISKSNEVTPTICGILGLDRERFGRTVMIAQGEFRKLLLADTKERMQLLRQIFGTGILERFSEKSKELATSAKSDMTVIADGIDRYASLIETKDDVLSDMINNGVRFVRRDEFYSAVEAELENEKKEVDELNVSLAEISSAIKDITEKVNKAKQDKQLEERIESVEKRFGECVSALEKAREKAGNAEKYRSDAQDERDKIEQIDGLLEKVYEAEKLANEAENIHKTVVNFRNDSKQMEEQLENSRNIESELDSSIREAYEKTSHLAEIMAMSGEVQAEKKALESYSEKISEYYNVSELVKLCDRRYKKVREKFDTVSNKYDNVSRKYFDSIAGILAEKLVDGEKCPVCGSTVHPEPAHIEEDVVSKDELDDMKKQRDDAESQLSEYAGELGIQKSQLEKIITELSESSLFSEDIEITKQRLNNAIDENSNKSIELENKITELKQISEKAESDRNKLDEVRKGIDRMRDNLSEKKAELVRVTSVYDEKRRQLVEIQGKLPDSTTDELEKSREELSIHADMLEKKAVNAENELKNVELAHEAVFAEKNTLTEQLGESIADLYEGLKSEYDSLEERRETAMDELIRRKSIFKKNSETVDILKAEMEKFDKAEKVYRLYSEISDTSNGTLRGKEKITLEAFWQMRLFDRMIRRANLRLLEMSDGRYELERRAASGLRTQTGLELDIKDHWNGKVRDVKTLSGGESFMASLALALALSDETEAESGGIHIDSLFIDEGFGSLDSNSLDNALKVLTSQARGRDVAVISHVDALKDRIDNKIIVKKGQVTSSAEICIEH